MMLLSGGTSLGRSSADVMFEFKWINFRLKLRASGEADYIKSSRGCDARE